MVKEWYCTDVTLYGKMEKLNDNGGLRLKIFRNRTLKEYLVKILNISKH